MMKSLFRLLEEKRLHSQGARQVPVWAYVRTSSKISRLFSSSVVSNSESFQSFPPTFFSSRGSITLEQQKAVPPKSAGSIHREMRTRGLHKRQRSCLFPLCPLGTWRAEQFGRAEMVWIKGEFKVRWGLFTVTLVVKSAAGPWLGEPPLRLIFSPLSRMSDEHVRAVKLMHGEMLASRRPLSTGVCVC